MASPLPNDVIFDILLQMPVRTLCKLSCVSVSWSDLISDPIFQQHHRRRSSEQKDPLLFIATVDDHYGCPKIIYKDTTNLDTVAEHRLKDDGLQSLKSVVTFLDLVCMLDYGPEVIYVCNPAMKKWIPLPVDSPQHEGALLTQLVALGYVASTSEYKVFRIISDLPRGSVNKFEVLTLGPKRRWRAVRRPPSDVHRCCVSVSTTVHGSVYIMCASVHGGYIISVFDLKQEGWSLLPVPPQHDDSLTPRALMDAGGTLRLACVALYRLELWLLTKDGGNQTWVKEHAIDTYTLDISLPIPLATVQEGKVLFKTSTHRLLRYDPRDKTVEEIYHGKKDFTISFYAESSRSVGIHGFKHARRLQKGEWRVPNKQYMRRRERSSKPAARPILQANSGSVPTKNRFWALDEDEHK